MGQGNGLDTEKYDAVRTQGSDGIKIWLYFNNVLIKYLIKRPFVKEVLSNGAACNALLYFSSDAAPKGNDSVNCPFF